MFGRNIIRPRHHRKNSRRVSRPLWLEVLERRDQPSAGFLSSLMPSIEGASISPLAQFSSTAGLTPAVVRHAYGFDQINFGGVAGDGSGQTIAIVTAFNNPNVERNLAEFNRAFGLPDVPMFQRVGGFSARTDPSWALETDLDVQWTHAIAPRANILLVQAESNSLDDMLRAVDYARHQPDVDVVSMSWGTSEFFGQAGLDQLFTTPAGHSGVSFVAASGDSGAAAGAMWPAASPNVLAVGGTRLTVGANGAYIGETAWSGSGGGVSRFSVSGVRNIPDVAYAAAPEAGFLVYTGGKQGWVRVGGTSAGAPQWAGLIAITQQGRDLAGVGSIKNVRSAILDLPSSAFNDVTTGSNGFLAGVGYDLATGRGSPDADEIVSLLIDESVPSVPGFIGPVQEPEVAMRKTPPAPIRIEQIAQLIVRESSAPRLFTNQLGGGNTAFSLNSQLRLTPQLPANVGQVIAPTTTAPSLSLAPYESGYAGEEEGAGGEATPDAPPAEALPVTAMRLPGAISATSANFVITSAGSVVGNSRHSTGAHMPQPNNAVMTSAAMQSDEATATMAVLAGIFGGYLVTPRSNGKKQHKPQL